MNELTPLYRRLTAHDVIFSDSEVVYLRSAATDDAMLCFTLVNLGSSRYIPWRRQRVGIERCDTPFLHKPVATLALVTDEVTRAVYEGSGKGDDDETRYYRLIVRTDIDFKNVRSDVVACGNMSMSCGWWTPCGVELMDLDIYSRAWELRREMVE